MKDFLRSIFENLIAQIILTLVLWIITSVAAYFSLKFIGFSVREYVLIAILLLLGFIILSYIIYRLVKRKEIPSFRVRNYQLKILKIEWGKNMGG